MSSVRNSPAEPTGLSGLTERPVLDHDLETWNSWNTITTEDMLHSHHSLDDANLKCD